MAPANIVYRKIMQSSYFIISPPGENILFLLWSEVHM